MSDEKTTEIPLTLHQWFETDMWGDLRRPSERFEVIVDLARDCITHPARGWSSTAVPDEERPQGNLWEQCRSLAESIIRTAEEEAEEDEAPDLVQSIAAVLEAVVMDFARREDERSRA